MSALHGDDRWIGNTYTVRGVGMLGYVEDGSYNRYGRCRAYALKETADITTPRQYRPMRAKVDYYIEDFSDIEFAKRWVEQTVEPLLFLANLRGQS